MRNKKNIFSTEIELSDIVLRKTDQAFEIIQQEDVDSMKKTNREGKKSFKIQAAAIAGVCLFAVSSISTAAAIHHYWGRGMSGNLQASATQQQALLKMNIAKVYREEPESPSLAVTDHGVTIEPDTIVVDERFAYMSFRISGYHVEDRMEPGFEMVDVYQGDNPEDDNSWVNINGTMYNGIIPDENGDPMYDDGTPLEHYDNGSTICHYTDGMEIWNI